MMLPQKNGSCQWHCKNLASRESGKIRRRTLLPRNLF